MIECSGYSEVFGYRDKAFSFSFLFIYMCMYVFLCVYAWENECESVFYSVIRL